MSEANELQLTSKLEEINKIKGRLEYAASLNDFLREKCDSFRCLIFGVPLSALHEFETKLLDENRHRLRDVR